MAEQKIYAPLSAVEKEFANGGSILKLSGKADKLIEFIRANANDKGYINLVVGKRREIGQYGDTHSVTLDTWKPKESRNGGAPPSNQPPKDDDLGF